MDDNKGYIKVYPIIMPTIGIMLTALGELYRYADGCIKLREKGGIHIYHEFAIPRTLLKADKTEASLFDQEESTQLTIARLLGYKE